MFLKRNRSRYRRGQHQTFFKAGYNARLFVAWWPMPILAIVWFLWALFLTSSINASQTSSVVDVEIVLAVDASGSVNKDELQLQLNGIAMAFRDPDVLNAISRGTHRSVAVAMLIWSDAGYAKYPTGWFVVSSKETAEKFAAKVENFNDRHGALTAIGGGGTGLGSGLVFALNMLDVNNIEGLRKIVDVSGDGPETRPWNKGAITLPSARVMATLNAVTVNGLAIETDIPDLTYYYRKNVLVGPASFAITAQNFEDFARAMKLKLLREFSPVAIGRLENSTQKQAGG